MDNRDLPDLEAVENSPMSVPDERARRDRAYSSDSDSGASRGDIYDRLGKMESNTRDLSTALFGRPGTVDGGEIGSLNLKLKDVDIHQNLNHKEILVAIDKINSRVEPDVIDNVIDKRIVEMRDASRAETLRTAVRALVSLSVLVIATLITFMLHLGGVGR